MMGMGKQGLRVFAGAVVVTLVTFGTAHAEVAAKSLDDIRACMRANLPDTSYQQNVKLTSLDPSGGQRTLVADLYGVSDDGGGIKLMLSVKEPADLSGSRYLLIERESRDDMFVYLPAVGRTRRIIGGMRGQPLWGTDFSYEDIKHLQGVLSDSSAEYMGVGERASRSIHRLQVVPSAEMESPYQRIELEVDDVSCLVAEARFFDSAGLSKRMTSEQSSMQKVGERWILGLVSMQNLRNNSSSSIAMADIVFDERLSLTMFNPKTFHLAR